MFYRKQSLGAPIKCLYVKKMSEYSKSLQHTTAEVFLRSAKLSHGAKLELKRKVIY